MWIFWKKYFWKLFIEINSCKIVQNSEKIEKFKTFFLPNLFKKNLYFFKVIQKVASCFKKKTNNNQIWIINDILKWKNKVSKNHWLVLKSIKEVTARHQLFRASETQLRISKTQRYYICKICMTFVIFVI